ncbi:MAG: T9SS type A sorting domain-containing protein [Bacteroidota bacterium]
MKKLYLFLFIVLFCNNLYSQLQDRIWIFGSPFSDSSNATLYFGNLSNPVVNIPNGQPNNITVDNGSEQWAVVTNLLTGNLIFYTDGKNVFNNQNELVSNMDLGANVSSCQPVAISPVPHLKYDNDYDLYYIFSNATGADASTFDIGTVTYRIYNATSQTFGPSNNLPGIYGTTNVTEGMKIIPCDNNHQILWLVVSLIPDPGFERKYVVYKINKNAITYQGNYDMGPQKMLLPSSGASTVMDITYTKANTIPGITNVGFALQYSNAVFTCQFDNINGQFLTNTVKVCNTGYTSSIPSVYNVEFSPNGKFLYYSVYYTAGDSNELYQVDLQNSVLTPTLVHSYGYRYAGGLKLGPDGLIYHIYDCGYSSNVLKLGRILQPDIKYIPGVTPYNQFYEESFKTYNNVFGFGLCEFLVSPTAPSGIFGTMATNTTSISIYPNPASDIITLNVDNRNNANLTLNIYNVIGELIKSELLKKNQQQINISNLNNGIYIVVIKSKELTENQKLIIQKQ